MSEIHSRTSTFNYCPFCICAEVVHRSCNRWLHAFTKWVFRAICSIKPVKVCSVRRIFRPKNHLSIDFFPTVFQRKFFSLIENFMNYKNQALQYQPHFYRNQSNQTVEQIALYWTHSAWKKFFLKDIQIIFIRLLINPIESDQRMLLTPFLTSLLHDA